MDQTHAHCASIDPLWEQYAAYLGDLARLDLNYSLSSYPSRVADQIGAALPWTIALLGTTSLLAWAIGSLLGAALAWRSQPRLARFMFPPLMMLSAAPYFITGMLLLYVLGFRLRLFPLGGGVLRLPRHLPGAAARSTGGGDERHHREPTFLTDKPGYPLVNTAAFAARTPLCPRWVGCLRTTSTRRAPRAPGTTRACASGRDRAPHKRCPRDAD